MSADPAFLGRVRRLAVVSAVDLGVIWALAAVSLEGHAAIELALLLGWLSMPTILGFSLRYPAIRLLVAVPAVLVGAALIAICWTALPDHPVARAGWLVTTAGILFGGVLGSWFWYRWLPVPAPLQSPFSKGRWFLIAVHVALVVAGQFLVAAAKLI